MSLWIDPHEVDLTCRERRQPCQNNAQEGLAAGNVKVTYIKFNRQQFLFRNYDIGFSDIADIPKTVLLQVKLPFCSAWQSRFSDMRAHPALLQQFDKECALKSIPAKC